MHMCACAYACINKLKYMCTFAETCLVKKIALQSSERKGGFNGDALVTLIPQVDIHEVVRRNNGVWIGGERIHIEFKGCQRCGADGK
jgi:hypothetical protein